MYASAYLQGLDPPMAKPVISSLLTFVESATFRGSRAMPVEHAAFALLSDEATALGEIQGVPRMTQASLRLSLRALLSAE